MKSLYLHNFKGFRNTFLDLENVNFFVGENSTGKTSVLKLINILSNRKFWSDLSFNNSEVELGHFEEIVHKNSTTKSFEIGIEQTFNNRRFLLNFVEFDSLPQLESLKYSVDSANTILLNLKAKEIFVRKKVHNELTFRKWIKYNKFSKTYKKVKFPVRQMPLDFLLSFIDGRLSNDLRNDELKFEYTISSEEIPSYVWLAPIRAKAKRTYESFKKEFSPEGDHIPNRLRNLFSKQKSSKLSARIIPALELFGRQSNLFDKIIVEELGKKNSSPFKIKILYNKIPILLPNVGYGVSQVLPLIIEILSRREYLFSIQQPEVHLHPRAQAAFGEFIFNSMIADQNRFIIETHSDFTINRFRYCLANSKRKRNNESAQVVFFERTTKGTKLSMIKIDQQGRYQDEIPRPFREFFIDEEMKLLEL